MKRKVFLILLALVLALSVGLVACAEVEQEEEEEEEDESPGFAECLEQYLADCIDCECDAGPLLYEGQLVDGGRYYATGGGAARHDYDGVDIWAPVAAIPGTAIEGPMLVGMLHSGDWVVYHFKLTQDRYLWQIDLCLQNYKLPSGDTTEVEVYAMSGNDLPYQPHNADFQTTGWEGPWKVNIDNVSWGKIYSVLVSSTIGPSSDFLVAVYLRNGEFYQAPDFDRNVYICWINLVELDDQPPPQ